MAEANKFWQTAPYSKIGTHPNGWRPGETRSYIPVVSFGVPENTPQDGLIGKAQNMDGDKRVSFIVRAKNVKSGGTNHRDPQDKKG
jgi:hypothetical protein